MPQVKEVRPYVLRHSLTTLVRNRGATRWDLEGFMGHRSSSLRSANIRPSSPPWRASFSIWKPSHPAHCAGTAREQTSPAHSREAEKCCHNNDLERWLTGLITIHAGLRKAQVLAGALIGGPRVAHTKFGPIFGVEPASIGTPCIASKLNEIGDSGCLKPFVGGATGHLT